MLFFINSIDHQGLKLFPNIVISRIGWMRNYNGEGAEIPHGAGTYNHENIGHEIFNFREVESSIFGFIQNRAKGGEDGSSDKINLPRIGNNPPYDPWSASIRDCIVIFISPHPEGLGNYIVGWYEKAEVFLLSRLPEGGLKEVRGDKIYNIQVDSSNAFLIPEEQRIFKIDHGKNKPGTSNTFYFYDEKSEFDENKREFLEEILNYIKVVKDNFSSEKMVEEMLLSSLERKSSGFCSSPEQRKCIEEYSMGLAIKHYEEKGFVVENKSLSNSYDLLLRKGQNTYYVEVKGLSSAIDKIILTKNEYELALKEKRTKLFIVHSINYDKNSNTACDGVVLEFDVFQPLSELAEPISFFYDIRSHLNK